jgi:hypothetical protein
MKKKFIIIKNVFYLNYIFLRHTLNQNLKQDLIIFSIMKFFLMYLFIDTKNQNLKL